MVNLVTLFHRILVERFQIVISVIKFFLHLGTSNGHMTCGHTDRGVLHSWSAGWCQPVGTGQALYLCVLPCTDNRFSGSNDWRAHTFICINKAVTASFTHVLGTATASSKRVTCKTNIRNSWLYL